MTPTMTWTRPTYQPKPLSDEAYRALIRADLLRAAAWGRQS
jgi:hypothetical protein